MPEIFIQLSVLISCPSDMDAERQVIKAAINEVNELLMQTHRVVLKMISWETDLLPGLGPDPQSVINSQIKGRYDIYIGLLGARFGTETPRAGSGTEEEFRHAFATYEASPETIRVLFYFKATSDNLHRLDLEQLRKVIKFRKELSSTALFSEFSDKDSLLKLIKTHLHRLVNEQWDGNKWRILTPLTQTPVVQTMHQGREVIRLPETLLTEGADEESDEQERSAAILDVIVSAENGFETGLEALNNITALTTKLTADMTSRTGISTQSTAREMKSVVDGIAGDLATYTNGLKKQLPTFKANLGDALSNLDTAIELYLTGKMGPLDKLTTLLEQLGQFESNMRLGRDSLDSFRKIIDELPGYTSNLNKSKRMAKRILGDLSASVTVFMDKIEVSQARIINGRTLP